MKKEKAFKDPAAVKLDFKRTFKVGIAFLIIMSFWELYDYAVPLLLNRTFGLNASLRGIIMGLDNLLALFLLPLFGAISDKSKTKFGRRTPFIFIGTLAAVVFMMIMIIIENAQLNLLLQEGVTDAQSLVSAGFLDPQFLGSQYQNLEKGTALYHEYSQAMGAAQQQMALSFTKNNPAYIASFISILLVVLIAMSVFRSPAVALMPDVTVKPLRSQANAVINFMGGAGGFVSIILYTIMAKQYGSYVGIFAALAVFMLVALAVFLAVVKEPKYITMRLEEEKRWSIVDEEELSVGKLPKPKTLSLILILATVFFWFMGFNAVKSHLSVYATTYLGFTESQVGIINIVNGVGGAIGLIPVAFMAAKWGRKKTVMLGLIIAAVAFIPAFFVTYTAKWWLLALFVIAGFGLTIINVNTLPMVVELSKGSNVGKYTGYYYAFSMSAQAITPFFAGLFMDNISQRSVFIYGVIMILLGFVTMLFVKHGDNKPEKPKSKLEYFNGDAD